MKKNLFALLMAMVMVLTLVACGGKEEPKEEEIDTNPPVENVVIEPEVVDPEANTPASPEEEPGVAPEMPSVDSTPAVTPEVEEEKEEKPVEETKPEEKPADAPQAPAAGNVDLNAFYLSLVETYGENFPANMNLCEMQEMLDTYYPQLSAIDTKQMMIYQPMMGAVVCEIALVEVTNAADVETVKTILQGRIDEQVNGGAWYPESIEGWTNNSRVVANGNYVMMIAYSECDAVVSSFNALF